jgi:hypothetical protein
MHSDNCIQRVGLAVEHGASFQILGVSSQLFDALLQIQENIFALAGKVNVGFNVFCPAHEPFIVSDHGFKSLAIAHDGLAGRWIVPQRRIGQLLFYFGEFATDASRVKDTPAGRVPGRARESMRIRDRLMPRFSLRT